MGFRSHIHGSLKIDLDTVVDRRARRFMGDGAAYNFVAMEQAIADAGLEDSDISNERTGLVMGSGGTSTKDQVLAADLLREKGSSRRVGPFMVPRIMTSHEFGDAFHLVQDQGRQLLHQLRLFHLRPLHR